MTTSHISNKAVAPNPSPNSPTKVGPNIQPHEPMWAILIRTTTTLHLLEICACKYVHMSVCLWRPEVNIRGHSSVSVHLALLRVCLWCKTCRLGLVGWPESSRGEPIFTVPKMGVSVHSTQQFLCGCQNLSSVFYAYTRTLGLGHLSSSQDAL